MCYVTQKKKKKEKGGKKEEEDEEGGGFKGRGLYNRVLLQSGIRARAALKAADSRCPALKLVVRPGGGRRQLSPPPFVFFCFSSLSLSLCLRPALLTLLYIVAYKSAPINGAGSQSTRPSRTSRTFHSFRSWNSSRLPFYPSTQPPLNSRY